MRETLFEWYTRIGLGENLAALLVLGTVLVGILLLSGVAYGVARWGVARLLRRVAGHTRTQWDDALVKQGFFRRLSHLAPAVVIYNLLPLALQNYPVAASWAERLATVYMLGVGMLVGDSLLNAGFAIYRSSGRERRMPIKGFVQVAKLVLYGAVLVLMISVLLAKPPMMLLGGMGAMTAVLMLVFKDPILGFVAGIQLTSNRLLAVGDWIEMPKYGADGSVIEVALTTVKIQNWDMTITAIPTYALISDSFKNWQGMAESGGRRIKRAVHIDLQTIRFCTEEMLERFRKIQYIAAYICEKQAELDEYNRQHGVDSVTLANGRRLTNIGTFRAYVIAYLRHHPMINQNMTFLVRQLAPTPRGLPLEIYVFSKEKRWVDYEAIQADIFDHILAVASEFDLRLFQEPSGNDLVTLAATAGKKRAETAM
jgi:miniconductance mechanosensitive channel